ncbi:MAG: hypothetical protein WCZ90_00640 [Melioribacteraceae bacterium]
MNLSKINSSTIAIIVAAAIILAAGFYTQNVGFQLAGPLVLLVGCILAFNQERGRNGDKTM